MIGTFVLIMGLLFIGANDFTDGLNPAIVGLLIVAIGVSLGGTTGYAINPARDLGHELPMQYYLLSAKVLRLGLCAIPVFGPIIGGVYGAVFYNAFFVGEITALFWIMSAVVLVIVIVAVSKELRKNNTNIAEKASDKVV